MAKQVLMLASAFIVFLLGFLHLAYTFQGPKLLPRDPALIQSMKSVHLVLTRETTVWKAWIGFNATHSLSAILFGLVYGYLAVAHPGVLHGSVYLQAVGLLMLASLTVLSFRYFFSIPSIGLSIALGCYVASLVIGRFEMLRVAGSAP